MRKHTSGKSVIFFQEKIQPKKLFEYQWRGAVLFNYGTSNSKEVSICFRYDLDHNISEFICDKNGRYIIARMEIQDQPYVLMNCYASNSEKGQNKIFEEVSKHLVDMDITPGYTFILQGIGILLSMRQEILLPVLKRKTIFQLKSIMSTFDLVGIW